MFYVGCAGWTIPRQFSKEFPEAGSHLERYSRVLPCAEINSSFYRLHRESTWRRWADAVPSNFRFSVKAPKSITHERRLECTSETESELRAFFQQLHPLGDKLGPILFQTPPKLVFDDQIVRRFLALLRSLHASVVTIEPRHLSWFTDAAERALTDFRVVRVAADPAVCPAAALPGGSPEFSYHRLHGAPRRYYSAYSEEFLMTLATRLQHAPDARHHWCIFDNTASGAAAGDALRLMRLL
ncbi:MAG: DUF72 domain-containing protein [Acidobacteriaceae bacterium]